MVKLIDFFNGIQLICFFIRSVFVLGDNLEIFSSPKYLIKYTVVKGYNEYKNLYIRLASGRPVLKINNYKAKKQCYRASSTYGMCEVYYYYAFRDWITVTFKK